MSDGNGTGKPKRTNPKRLSRIARKDARRRRLNGEYVPPAAVKHHAALYR